MVLINILILLEAALHYSSLFVYTLTKTLFNFTHKCDERREREVIVKANIT